MTSPASTPAQETTWVMTPRCMHCGETSIITMTVPQWQAWVRDGGLVQNVFPKKTPAEREHLSSGIHPKCWEDLFGSPEQD